MSGNKTLTIISFKRKPEEGSLKMFKFRFHLVQRRQYLIKQMYTSPGGKLLNLGKEFPQIFQKEMNLQSES